MGIDLVLTNLKACLEKGIVDCCLGIENGRILAIGKEANMPKAENRMNLQNLLVLPGLIDSHVHLRDEGKAHKEDFHTGTAAAAAGGFTTVLDMPNNVPVTMSAETLKNRMRIAERRVLVDVGFFSEFPKEIEEIDSVVAEGAVAFKLFMVEQVGGLDIDDDSAILKAFKAARALKVPVAAHAEDKQKIDETKEKLMQTGFNDFEAFLETHSEEVETSSIRRLLNLAKQTSAHVHFCHVSTINGLAAIVDAKKTGIVTTCEITPHHLLLSTDELKRLNGLALTMPPLRGKQQMDGLWNGFRNQQIDTIGSDHAPHELREKTAKAVWDVKVGIPGLETALPLLLTEVKRGRLTVTDVVRLMAERPAKIFGLKDKGLLKEGYRADLTVVNLNVKYKIDSSQFQSKAKYSPFDGWIVEGRPVKAFVNGQLVMDEGEIVAKAGSGHVIRRERSS